MQYLLDANVLIDANRDYYPIGRIPEFWDWLLHRATEGSAKVLQEVYEEIKDSKDDLGPWIKNSEVKQELVLSEEVDVSLVRRSINDGYANDLTDDEVVKVGRDPFLLAYALAQPGNRCIVTTEVSKPKRQRANRHLPDICRQFSIPCCNTFEFIRALDFKTNWKP